MTAASHYLNLDTLRVSSICSPSELDEFVILESHVYRKIFGDTKKNADDSRKRLSIVKICYQGKSIHRAYMSKAANGFTEGHVALTPNSIDLLSSNPKTILLQDVILSKGCWWNFYWNHPRSATRMSFRMGIVGILFTLVTSFLAWLFSGMSVCWAS